MQYLVTWEIDIDDENPEEAARQALEIMQDKFSEATVFRVQEKSTGEVTTIDLAYDEITVVGKIDFIRDVIEKFGSFTTFEVEADCSPTISLVGDMSVTIEQFDYNTCTACLYIGGSEVSSHDYAYDELSAEVIADIYELAKKWNELQGQEV